VVLHLSLWWPRGLLCIENEKSLRSKIPLSLRKPMIKLNHSAVFHLVIVVVNNLCVIKDCRDGNATSASSQFNLNHSDEET
jgi:hypothetical protein